VASGNKVWWSQLLKLASIQGIPEALALPFDAPIDVAGKSPSGSLEQATMTNCETYFTLRKQGYEARSEVDFAAMKVEGARCHALTALRNTASPSAHPLDRFSLGRDALAELPPALGPEPSPGERERRENATRQGISWSAFDPQATITTRGPESGIVKGPDWTTRLEILVRGDFTGDGTMGVLLRTVSYGTEGSWKEVRLRILSREGNKPVLVIRGELLL
jgi:hypothetical protein